MGSPKTCPSCHDGDTKQLSAGVWLGLAAALVVAGIFIPIVGVLFIVAGVGVLVATPLLAKYGRCTSCGKVGRGEAHGAV